MLIVQLGQLCTNVHLKDTYKRKSHVYWPFCGVGWCMVVYNTKKCTLNFEILYPNIPGNQPYKKCLL